MEIAPTSICGGVAEGVLGCATDSGDITLIEGWNWYTGADAGSIRAGQYDFQTIVTHELAHELGLDHSDDSSSVMYETLPTGVARRLPLEDRSTRQPYAGTPAGPFDVAGLIEPGLYFFAWRYDRTLLGSDGGGSLRERLLSAWDEVLSDVSDLAFDGFISKGLDGQEASDGA